MTHIGMDRFIRDMDRSITGYLQHDHRRHALSSAIMMLPALGGLRGFSIFGMSAFLRLPARHLAVISIIRSEGYELFARELPLSQETKSSDLFFVIPCDGNPGFKDFLGLPSRA
jgi:hypothetical protein